MGKVLKGGSAVGVVFIGGFLASVEHCRVGIAVMNHFEGEEIIVYCVSYNYRLVE
jgi:hypothetical protein